MRTYKLFCETRSGVPPRYIMVSTVRNLHKAMSRYALDHYVSELEVGCEELDDAPADEVH
jgi:hypothetical protein